MTAKREAELETEVRMLREQVASLERVIAGMQPVIRLDPGYYVAPAAQQQWPQQWWTWPAVWCGTDVISGSISPVS